MSFTRQHENNSLQVLWIASCSLWKVPSRLNLVLAIPYLAILLSMLKEKSKRAFLSFHVSVAIKLVEWFFILLYFLWNTTILLSLFLNIDCFLVVLKHQLREGKCLLTLKDTHQICKTSKAEISWLEVLKMYCRITVVRKDNPVLGKRLNIIV